MTTRTLLLLLLLLVGCQRGAAVPAEPASPPAAHPELATVEQPALSPSGAYLLKVQELSLEGGTVLRFQILDPSGKLLYFQKQGVPPAQQPIFLWDDQDRVWMYACEAGTFYWKASPTDPTDWHEMDYNVTQEAAPPLLRQRFPADHPY